MAVSLPTRKCPACGAQVSFKPDWDAAYCSYCGTKVMLSDEMKELRREEQEREESNRLRSTIFVVWVVALVAVVGFALYIGVSGQHPGGFTVASMLAGVGLPIALIGAYVLLKYLPDRDKVAKLIAEGGVYLPEEISSYVGKNCDTVQKLLTEEGFTNIQLVNLNDVKLGLFVKRGVITDISIGGKQRGTGERYYRPEVPIVITHHG